MCQLCLFYVALSYGMFCVECERAGGLYAVDFILIRVVIVFLVVARCRCSSSSSPPSPSPSRRHRFHSHSRRHHHRLRPHRRRRHCRISLKWISIQSCNLSFGNFAYTSKPLNNLN